MQPAPAIWTRSLSRGFTLVEIMIVVVIIGLLAAMAIPAFKRVQDTARANRFVSDLRTFAQAFETYATENGNWPPNAGSSVVPAGMSGTFKADVWTATTSVGGRWNWDRNMAGVAAGISVASPTFDDVQMAAIDAKIDDGNLTTGLFQKTMPTRFTFILER
jgi:prepilin-type N-terminal cleavage/methylation domain-containing protein